MGVSFKVSKKGTRFCPKPIQFERNSEECCTDYDSTSTILVPPHQSDLTSIPNKLPQDDVTEMGEDAAGISGSSSCSGGHITSAENEVSFMLNLYHDGYSVGKPSEASVQDTPKSLHPYDRTSETLFSAIESGRLPGDILDDIPSKYFDGMLLCEVRDYRKAVSDSERGVCSVDQSPVINRVSLRMSLENVVKDISLISDSWTYSDLLEVESRIVKAMQPQLCLDPTPMLDRLCGNPVTTKLNLGLCGVRKRRLRKMPEVSIMSNNQAYGKKVCIEKVQEGSNCRSGDSGTLSGDTTTMQVHESINAQHVSNSTLPLKSKSLGPDASTPPLSLLSKHQQGVDPRVMQDHYSGSAMNASGVPPSGREFMVSYPDPISGSMSSLHGKRENQDAPLTPSSKRARQTPVGLDGVQRQHLGSQLDSLSDISWNGPGPHLHADPRGVQYGSTGGQKYQKVLEAVPNQDASVSLFSSDHYGSRYGVKEELIKAEKLDRTEIDRIRNDSNILEAENSHMDTQQSRLQQRLPQPPLMRSHISQMQWHNLGQLVDNDPRKDDQLSKRKPVQSPRVSAVPVVQSPVSSKSGEFSSGSFGQQFNAVASTNTFGSSQKEKTGGISGATVGGPPSVTSSPSDSMQRQHQGTMAMKRRSNSVPRTPAMSGVGSPCSVGNMMVPMNASSPSISTQPLADQMILERFSKIETVTQRHKLNHKKNKVDDYSVRKPMSYSTQLLSSHLSNALINEELKDPDNPNPMSKSLIGGSMNVCKTRALTFLQAERRVQGNVSIVPKARNRLVMSEKQNDGTVAMQYGDIDDNDFQLVEDHMPTLPNTYYADLLGAQFISLMIREGYQHTDDQVRPKPTASLASNTQSNASAVPSSGMTAEMQQYPETNTGQASSAITTSVSSGNASLNTPQSHQTNSWMLPPGSSQALQMSQGFMPGTARPVTPQQLDSQTPLMQQQLQNQHPQIQQHAQRPSLMSSASPLSHLNAIGQNSNVQLGNHMVSKSSHSHSQLQLLQQQQQQQQQQRKMMMGLGPAMNMGNLGNNVVGLGGLGNVLGMGGIRPGISPSMGPISGIGNMGQNPMNPSSINNVINQQLLSGNITHAQATFMASKFKSAQNRANMSRATQSGITGLTGTGQMHPGSAGFSMLGQTLNRSNINPLQRTNIAAMGPPKMIPGTNFFMNQQQQQLQQQHQQQQLQQQQQHMQQQQQQQISSPLQAVVSSPQVGSPSAMAIPQQITQLQQQISPQQINQQTPMSPRLSSGTLPPLNTTNAGTGPPSPQLSSQTLGSVGSITSSSMELQGVNKSNSMNNV